MLQLSIVQRVWGLAFQATKEHRNADTASTPSCQSIIVIENKYSSKTREVIHQLQQFKDTFPGSGIFFFPAFYCIFSREVKKNLFTFT